MYMLILYVICFIYYKRDIYLYLYIYIYQYIYIYIYMYTYIHIYKVITEISGLSVFHLMVI